MADQEEIVLAKERISELERLPLSNPTEALAKVLNIKNKMSLGGSGFFESQNELRNRRADAYLAIGALGVAIEGGKGDLENLRAIAIEKAKIWLRCAGG